MKFASTLSFARTGLAGLLLGLVAPAHAAGKPAPQVSVSLRGVAGQILEQGEPWRVAVRLDLPRGSKETLRLAPEAGTWADAIAVELYPATGPAAAARAEPVGKPEKTHATLNAERVAGGLWRFSPEAMQSVAPGNYVLRVRLALASGSGWRGVGSAREITLVVVPAAATPTTQRIVNRANDLLLHGRVEGAAALVDASLKTAPRDYSLLKVRAQIAGRAGNPLAAIFLLNAANFSTGNRKISGLPPPEDIELRERFEKSRRAAVASAPPPPAWSWPQAEVLLALSQEAKDSGFIPAMPPESAPGARPETATAVATPGLPPPIRPESAPAYQTPMPAAVSVAPAGPRHESGEIVPATELNDAKVSADPAGQWAASAVAGSQYGKTQYSAAQATGAPNIKTAGNSPDAWCPAGKNTGTDWLEVTFARPVKATEVRVRQNDTVGAITKIEAMEPDGTTHVWWEGVDPFKATAVREIVWFAVRVPKTSYLVARMKITLNLATNTGWKEIDAVQLIGAAQ